MPSLGFKADIADKVMCGLITETIRQQRVFPFKEGDTVHLFTGQKTNHCRRLGEGVITHTRKIRLTPNSILVDGEYAVPQIAFDIAVHVGYESWDKMVRHFGKHFNLPFDGIYLKWKLSDSVEFYPEQGRSDVEQDECLKDMAFSIRDGVSSKYFSKGSLKCTIDGSGFETWEIEFRSRPTWIQKKALVRLVREMLDAEDEE